MLDTHTLEYHTSAWELTDLRHFVFWNEGKICLKRQNASILILMTAHVINEANFKMLF